MWHYQIDTSAPKQAQKVIAFLRRKGIVSATNRKARMSVLLEEYKPFPWICINVERKYFGANSTMLPPYGRVVDFKELRKALGPE